MKKLLSGIKSLLSDERGSISSKRFVGLISALFLCITLYQNSFSEEHIAPSTTLVQSVTALTVACLGLTSLDKIFGKVQGKEEGDSESPKE
jgi:hypothetical protein